MRSTLIRRVYLIDVLSESKFSAKIIQIKLRKIAVKSSVEFINERQVQCSTVGNNRFMISLELVVINEKKNYDKSTFVPKPE